MEWTTYDVQRIDEDKAVFIVKTGIEPGQFKGKRVFDAGCGGGRYVYLAGLYGAEAVYGVDMSQAVEKAISLCKDMPNVHIVQGDLMNLPFEPGSFDIVYSIGVLHHTTDTKKAFDNIARYVKPGGTLAVWVYRKNTFIQEIVNDILRSITTRLPLKLLHYLSYIGVLLGGIPIINKILPRLINFSNHPDWKLRLCDTFDWFSPKYQYHHTVKEVESWFKEAGFINLKFLPPQKSGRMYDWAYNHNLLIGSGVNFQGNKPT
jgi:SAM-dependent methyltransferase